MESSYHVGYAINSRGEVISATAAQGRYLRGDYSYRIVTDYRASDDNFSLVDIKSALQERQKRIGRD